MRSDLEQALAGMAIHDPSVTALTGLSPADFTLPLCRMVWDAVQQFHGDGVAPDPISVAESVESRHGIHPLADAIDHGSDPTPTKWVFDGLKLLLRDCNRIKPCCASNLM